MVFDESFGNGFMIITNNCGLTIFFELICVKDALQWRHSSLFFRGKSFLELWATTFLPDWQLSLIFVRFIPNFLCMCSNSMDSAYVIFK